MAIMGIETAGFPAPTPLVWAATAILSAADRDQGLDLPDVGFIQAAAGVAVEAEALGIKDTTDGVAEAQILIIIVVSPDRTPGTVSSDIVRAHLAGTAVETGIGSEALFRVCPWNVEYLLLSAYLGHHLVNAMRIRILTD